MVEVTGKHAAKHAKSENAEISPGSLAVSFAPELRESLEKVINAVRYSPHFDGKAELFHDLKEFASGRMSALMVVRLMKDITEGIEQHTAATEDHTAKDAWQEFAEQIIDPPRGKSPFTFVQPEKAREPG